MNAPQTYSEWIDVFEMLDEGARDGEVAELMRSGNLEWQAGVAERFIKQFMAVLDTRMNRAIDKFDKILKRGDLNMMVRGMGALRNEFIYLANLTDLNFLSDNVRLQIRGNIVNASKQVQSSLEDSAKTDRTGKLQSILRNNKVTIE